MATDLSRIRRNPLLDYSGVLIRQGAVALDSEKNLATELTNRRLVALAGDVLGRSSVSQTTPRAFEITATASGFSIGVGRYYVDGLLVENHGAPEPARRRFDPVLGEPAFEDPVEYAAQPYFPTAPALPEQGTYIVYLEAWQREITPAMEPELVEIAVNVETSSRIQNVWQVKLLHLEGRPPLGCASGEEQWAAHSAPSTGVLSTGTVDVPEVEDPCELPPTGGYRGLENQLYRVEIHDPGLPGQGATFKFSRENASVETAVESVVHPKELVLKSLGRDSVLGFDQGDWIELTSEARELDGKPGDIRKIVGVDRDSRSIALDQDLSADLAPPGAERPPKGLLARRWDQQGTIRSVNAASTLDPFHDVDAASPLARAGVVPVPPSSTTLFLEDGLTVTFDVNGGAGFKSGDYWVFAARTGNADIERLDRAPPLGVCHHFARLAVWDASAQRVIDDCRGKWPPAGGPAEPAHDCACTVCVTPESHKSGVFTIHEAVKQVSHTGGTVCLAAGPYQVATPIEVVGARAVRIRGVSRGRLASRDAGTFLEGIGDQEVFAVRASDGVEIQDLVVTSRTLAVSVRDSANVVLERLAIDAVEQGIQLEDRVANLCIRDDEIRGKVGIRAEAVTHGDDVPLPERRHENALTFEDNWIVYEELGLQVMKVAATGDTWIQRNELQGSGKAIEVVHSSETSSARTTIARNHVEVSGERAIEVIAKRLALTENQVSVAGQGGPAIVVSDAEECRFEDNRVESNGPLPAARLQARVALVTSNRIQNPRDAVAIDVSGANQTTVLGNVTGGPIQPPLQTPWKELNVRTA